jgi:hypothetical protein
MNQNLMITLAKSYRASDVRLAAESRRSSERLAGGNGSDPVRIRRFALAEILKVMPRHV